MKKTVVIKCDDEGNYSVGEMPAMGGEMGMGGEMDKMGEMGGAEMSGLQPVESLEAALDQAKQMFAEDPEMEAENDRAFEDGYKQTSGMSGMEMMTSRGMK